MRDLLRLDDVSRPAIWLVLGRGVGFVAAFAVPLVLVRIFDQATFGTYKQLFLIYGTLYGVAQMGVAESLYYFVPRNPASAGRYALNAAGTLAVLGLACTAGLGLAAGPVARWFRNPQIEDTLVLLGLFLALMLTSALFEIVLVSRKQHRTAAYAYAASDLARAVLIVVPAVVFGGLRGMLWGAIAFAALRVVAMLWALWRDLDAGFRPSAALWRQQWAYTLPFALAVGMEVIQGSVHQYVVAARFDTATFAIYAVGCLQIPLVDIITTSGSSVMMVQMAEQGFDSRGPAALALWHDTMSRLALVIFPLTVFLLVMARPLVVALFTDSYLASVPIFMLWTLTIVFSVPCIDAVLRVHAQTRFLFGLNVLRLALVLGLIGVFLNTFGLSGAVLVTLLSTGLVRVVGVARAARLMGVGAGRVLPWKRFATTALHAGLAAVPLVLLGVTTSLAPLVLLAVGATLYGATYAGLCHFLSADSVRVTLAPVLPDTSS